MTDREKLIEAMARGMCKATRRNADNEVGDGMKVWQIYTDHATAALSAIEAMGAVVVPVEATDTDKKGQFRIGDRVTKIKGSQWTGRVVGFYSTTLTPEGYAVESETEIGSVQIYPATAIRALKDTP
jgi:dihydrofolate reductase (trimethoprim resistance protein)